MCRSGGIGRRLGLKIRWEQSRAGSNPVSGTTILYRGVEQLVARRAHNPEVGGSSPPPATIKPPYFVWNTVVFLTFWANMLFRTFNLSVKTKTKKGAAFATPSKTIQRFSLSSSIICKIALFVNIPCFKNLVQNHKEIHNGFVACVVFYILNHSFTNQLS